MRRLGYLTGGPGSGVRTQRSWKPRSGRNGSVFGNGERRGWRIKADGHTRETETLPTSIAPPVRGDPGGIRSVGSIAISRILHVA